MRRNAETEVLLAAFILTACVFVVYAGVWSFGFVNFDDGALVVRNPLVNGGLTAQGVRAAFTEFAVGNWHPVTWLSYMVDVSLFGLNPKGHHVVNLGLHATNAVLLFLLLRLLSGSAGASLFAAALFAVHPVHVESVAWVSSRKDLLALCFILSSALCWLRAVRIGGAGAKAIALFLFALAVMSKPVAVTLPFLLFLFDYWPVCRVVPFRSLIFEKVPFFLVAAGASLATWTAQNAAGAVAPDGFFPLSVRLANAVVSYATYLGKAVWPTGLSPFYPHPWLTGASHPTWAIAGAVLFLTGVSVAAFRLRSRRPWFFVGWTWFFVAFLPMIGIVYAGRQAMADRYTYLPFVGFYLVVACEATSAWERMGVGGRRALAGIGLAIIVASGVTAHGQASYWRDSGTLFRHALDVDPANWLAHANLGRVALADGKATVAMYHFEEAVRLYPDFHEAWFNIGHIRYRAGDKPGALRALMQGLRYNRDARAESTARSISAELGLEYPPPRDIRLR